MRCKIQCLLVGLFFKYLKQLARWNRCHCLVKVPDLLEVIPTATLKLLSSPSPSQTLLNQSQVNMRFSFVVAITLATVVSAAPVANPEGESPNLFLIEITC